jgi:hypothetical protein
MSPAQLHRGRNWTPEDDRKLLDMVEAGKSWVLMAAVLRRSQKSVKDRARTLRRLSRETDK